MTTATLCEFALAETFDDTSLSAKMPESDASSTAAPTPETSLPETAAATPPQPQKPAVQPSVQAVLEKLFELYPALFGAHFLPLKLGVFQDLLAKHPADFSRDSLKAALGLHTRSARYLQSVAAGNLRHGLDGKPVEAVAPEHVFLSIVELFRRKQTRSRADLGGELYTRLLTAIEASGLNAADYLARLPANLAQGNAPLEAALAEHGRRQAKRDALVSAFAASGKTPGEFADMYGLLERDVRAALSAAAVGKG